MISRIAGNWQTTMADLALILFIVSVASLNAAPERQLDLQPSPMGEAAAIYRGGDDAPPVGEWLAEQAPDERQHLTIVARYRPGEADRAARTALDLARQAGERGRTARIMLEEGEGGELLAVLAYDRPQDQVARSLHRSPED